MNTKGQLVILITGACLCFLMGCAQMDVKKTVFSAQAPIPELKCAPQVFLSRQEAEDEGEIEELCSVSAGVGLTLSDKEAVEGLKDKVCECGANNAYVLRLKKGVVGNKTATLIGFKFKANAKAESNNKRRD